MTLHFQTLFPCALPLASQRCRHTKPFPCLPLLDCSQWWQMSFSVACARPANRWCPEPTPAKALCITCVIVVPFTSHPMTLKNTRLPGISAGLQTVPFCFQFAWNWSYFHYAAAQCTTEPSPARCFHSRRLPHQPGIRGYTELSWNNSTYSCFLKEKRCFHIQIDLGRIAPCTLPRFPTVVFTKAVSTIIN